MAYILILLKFLNFLIYENNKKKTVSHWNIVGKTENKPLEGYEMLALSGPFDHK